MASAEHGLDEDTVELEQRGLPTTAREHELEVADALERCCRGRPVCRVHAAQPLVHHSCREERAERLADVAVDVEVDDVAALGHDAPSLTAARSGRRLPAPGVAPAEPDASRPGRRARSGRSSPAGSRSAGARAGPCSPTGPAILTSASQRIDVPSPSSVRWNCVCMFMSAPTPWPLAFRRRELGLALLRLLEVDLHAQAAQAERDDDPRGPVRVVVDVEALDARHQLRHALRVVEHLPHHRPRRRERARPVDLHRCSTDTPARDASGSRSRSHTRFGGLCEVATIGLPAERSASWIAAHTVCMGAPPPSPMPFVPSGVNGDGDSIASTFTGGMSSACGTW